jgi:hypothetical protein
MGHSYPRASPWAVRSRLFGPPGLRFIGTISLDFTVDKRPAGFAAGSSSLPIDGAELLARQQAGRLRRDPKSMTSDTTLSSISSGDWFRLRGKAPPSTRRRASGELESGAVPPAIPPVPQALASVRNHGRLGGGRVFSYRSRARPRSGDARIVGEIRPRSEKNQNETWYRRPSARVQDFPFRQLRRIRRFRRPSLVRSARRLPSGSKPESPEAESASASIRTRKPAKSSGEKDPGGAGRAVPEQILSRRRVSAFSTQTFAGFARKGDSYAS